MELNHDIVLEILRYLDVVSTLQFLSTSKKFWLLSTNQLLQNRINSYKQHIIFQQWNKGLVKAVNQIDFPQIFFFIDKGVDDIDPAWEAASLAGSKQLVEYLISLGSTCYQRGLCYAAQGGHIHLVDFFIEKGAMKDDTIGCSEAAQQGNAELFHYLYSMKPRKASKFLVNAAQGGNKDIIQFLEENGAHDWDDGVLGAARGGHLDLVEYFWNKTGDSIFISYAGEQAARYGHKNVVEWFASKMKERHEFVPWDHYSWGAVGGGSREVVDLCIDNGAKEWNQCLSAASFYGHLELVKFFVGKGANTFNKALASASLSDHREIILFLLDQGANEFEEAMCNAASCGHQSLVKLYLDKGATNLERALVEAATFQRKNTIALLLARGANLEKAIEDSGDDSAAARYLQQYQRQ